jgi:hypothetical protein
VNAASRPRTVTAQDTIAGGTVVLKVLSGSIALDGVAATP